MMPKPNLKLGLILLSLFVITGAPALKVEAFSSVTSPTRIRNRENKPIRTKNPIDIVASGSSSSLAAWHLSFGSAKKLPKIGRDGMYKITNEEDYRALMNEYPDKLIVIKIYSTWCKTCKAMAPKFEALARGLAGKKNDSVRLPIVWATLAHDKETHDFVRHTLKANTVPSVQLYAGNGVMVDSFPCGPAKVTKILKPKLVDLIANHVDLSTGTLKTSEPTATAMAMATTSGLCNTPASPQQPFVSKHPLKMLALFYQMLRSRLQRLMRAHKPMGNSHRKDGTITDQTVSG